MPCYGETICKLCKVGVYEKDEVQLLDLNDEEFNDINSRLFNLSFARPPWSSLPDEHDMQQLVGAVYIGNDVDDVVLNIRKHDEGYMGVWVDDSRNYKYDIIHQRCWKIAQKNKDNILKITREDKLHNALMLMINAFGERGVCPKDDSFNNHPNVIRLESSSWCYNVHNRDVHYFIEPFYEISKHMGQACDYSSVDVPNDTMVQSLLDTMLSARDWSKDVVFTEWGCPFCIEMHTKEEMSVIDKKPYDSYVGNCMYEFVNEQLKDKIVETDYEKMSCEEINAMYEKNDKLKDDFEKTDLYKNKLAEVEKEYERLKVWYDGAYVEVSKKRHQLWKKLVDTFESEMDSETKEYYEKYYKDCKD